MNKLSLLSVIRNNQDIIREWLEHYLAEGVSHFYLVDDNSTDKTREILKDYKKYVTFASKSLSNLHNAKGTLINNLFINRVKQESEWVMFAMPDEYAYARNRICDILDVFKKLDDNVEKIWIPSVYFGSNDLDKQPSSITKGFIKRQELEAFVPGANGRVLCRTEHLVRILDEGRNVVLSQNDIFYLCNGQKPTNFKFTSNAFSHLNLAMNTYMPMSKNYYEKQSKQLYGFGSSEYVRAMDRFAVWKVSYNKVIDTNLSSKIYAYNPDIYEA